MDLLIQNADSEVLEALQKFQATKKDLEINVREGLLSAQDEAHLQETIAMDERGELIYYTPGEMKALMNEKLRGLGAKV